MKKFIVSFIILLIGMLPVCASADNELPSETGVIKNVFYVDTPDLQQGSSSVKQVANIEIVSGDYKGEVVTVDNAMTGNPAYDIPLKKGDKVVLHLEKDSPIIDSVSDINFYIADLKRDNTLVWLSGIFFALLVLIGRKKGICSFISIVTTILLIFFGLIPMILSGFSPIVSASVIGLISTIITIYLVGGFNCKSTAAILGTGLSLCLAGIFSGAIIHFARLTGFVGEESVFLYTAHPELNFQGILTASMLIAALGALMDTSISIASTINELHENNPNLKKRQLFKSGMNVGKDIIGTMSNTLILVYVGNSLPLALLSSNIDLQKFFNLNQVATEISSALVGSIAILACVPLTAFIASFLLKNYKRDIVFSVEGNEDTESEI